MKVVINDCYGGFSLSLKALSKYYELKGKKIYHYKEDFKTKIFTQILKNFNKHYISAFSFLKDFGYSFINPEWKDKDDLATKEYNDIWDYHVSSRDIPRTDLDLIKVVEELGEEANGSCAKLKIVEIPDGIEWEIDEYDGIETIEEVHRSWS